MSLLTIVQQASLRVLKISPSVAVSSTDANVLQLVALVNEEGQELSSRYSWQILTAEATFTTVATAIQGVITTLAGAGFNFFVNQTMWNRSQRRPLYGPLTPQQWQEWQAAFSSGPWISYRLRQNNLLFFPSPTAGQSVYFEWVTKYWATNSTGLVSAASMSADTDVALLDERLITLGAIWRFKKASDLDYQEDFDKYEAAVNDAITRDGSRPILNLGGVPESTQPGTIVPAGNWTL
jgi:hypothetical protein